MALTKTSSNNSSHDVVQLVNAVDAEPVAMSISADGMAHILARLTDLYSNPIEATVREVVSNAIDATVMMPKAERKPVQITLPGALRTAFVVQDFGVGMSEQTVREIYSQYGASTKRDNMKQIGAYGLGAKAPLAYCSEFSVRTTHAGWTTVFNISRETGGNFVKIVSVEETNDASGTIVTIPVKMSDSHSFSEALKSYRSYSFDVPITIDGRVPDATDFVLIKDDFVLDRDVETGEETLGRVWIRKSALSELFQMKFSRSSYDTLHFSYTLSGWAYKPPTDRSWRQREPRMMVELKPGVVDFSSSRDEITNNERSQRLDRAVNDFIKGSTAAATEELLAIYRGFSKDHAQAFFTSMLWHGEIKHKALWLNGSEEFALSVDDFITDEGYSPLAPLVATYPKNVISAYMVNQDSRNFPTLNTKLWSPDSSDLFGVKSAFFTSDTVTVGNSNVMEHMEDNKAHTSFAELFLFYAAHHSRSKSGVQRVIVLKDASPADVKRILGYRRLFAENDFFNVCFVMAKSNGLKAQMDLIKEHAGLEVEVMDTADLIKLGKDYRKENRAVNVQDTSAMALRELTPDGLATETEVVQKARNSYLDYVKISPADLVKKNGLIVLTRSSAASALIGAANAGVQITNRPVYLMENNRGLKAAHYKSLAGYSGVVASTDFSYKSKDAQDLADKVRFSGRMLSSELKAADRDAVVRSVLSSLYVGKPFYALMESHLKAQHKEDRAAVKILHAAASMDRYHGSRLGSLSNDEIKVSLPAKEAETLINLRRAMQHFSQETTFEDSLVAQLMQFRGKVEGPSVAQLAETLYAYMNGKSEVGTN